MRFYEMFELLLLVSSVQANHVDWCKRGCRWLGQKHLKCVFHQRRSNELCPNIESVITPAERRDMLLYHNALRDDVAAVGHEHNHAHDLMEHIHSHHHHHEHLGDHHAHLDHDHDHDHLDHGELDHT